MRNMIHALRKPQTQWCLSTMTYQLMKSAAINLSNQCHCWHKGALMVLFSMETYLYNNYYYDAT